MDQILVTKEYQSVPVPEDLIKAISETDSYGNNNQANRFDNNHPIIQNDHPTVWNCIRQSNKKIKIY